MSASQPHHDGPRVESVFSRGKCQAQYVQHLEYTHELSEDLLQTEKLQQFLVNELGKNYLDWFEGAPNVKIGKGLDTLISD